MNPGTGRSRLTGHNSYKRLALSLFFIGVLCVPSLHAAPVPVEVAKLRKQNLVEKVTLNASVFSSQSTSLASEVDARVEAVYVEVGDQVTQGHALARMRDTPTSLQLTAAKARWQEDKAGVKLAEIEERRLSRLLQHKATSQESYDAAVARFAQAQAGAKASKALADQLADKIEQHIINAPFDGIITERLVAPGTWINRSQDLLAIVSMRHLHARIAVPQRLLDKVEKGQRVELSAAPQSKAWVGRVIPVIDTVTRTFTVWIDFEDNKGFIPGLATSATLQVPSANAAQWVVPKDAIIKLADGSHLIWLLTADAADNNLRRVRVDLGRSSLGYVEIFGDGLSQNDSVIVRGNETLRPGQSVIVKDQDLTDSGARD